MSRLTALSAYIQTFGAGYPAGTAAQAREWMEQTEVSAADAARLAAMGYTPAIVNERLAAAPVRYGDERDTEAVVAAMLYGPTISDVSDGVR